MSRRHREGLAGGTPTSMTDLLWNLLVAFLVIIFALMAEQVRQDEERRKVEKVAEIIQRSPGELHEHFTWIPYTLDERQQGIKIGDEVVSGMPLEAFLSSYHITLLRQGWDYTEDPSWWTAALKRHKWGAIDPAHSSSHGPIKGKDEEHLYPPLEIRFHGAWPSDPGIQEKLAKVRLYQQYRVRNGEVYIGGAQFTRQQLTAILSQTQGLFIYLREGTEGDPAWLKDAWKIYHFADFDRFEALWRRK